MMNPSNGFELNESSSVSVGAGSLTPLNSTDSNQITFAAGLSFKLGPLIKILVPPLNEA